MDNIKKGISKTLANEAFVLTACYILIGIIIVLLLLLAYRKNNLEASNCSLMDGLYSKLNGSLRSINVNDADCGYTFKDYYIKTAFNSCSGGDYKNGVVTTCVLKNLLRQGVRGLDFEIYSIDDRPVVATSTVDDYYIKETYNYVFFSDAMSIILNYAFSNSTSPNPEDPIVLHLRIKSENQKMYENFASLFKSYTPILLGKDYSYESYSTNLGDVALLELKKKIIIIVDRSNPAFMENKNFLEYVNMTSSSIFMRSLRYYDVKYNPDLKELQIYNKKNMTIVLPDKGMNPENPNCIITRETGCQMSAMRFQQLDQNLEESMLFFDMPGYAFALKPERLRYIPDVVADPEPQNPELSYETRDISSDFYSFNI